MARRSAAAAQGNSCDRRKGRERKGKNVARERGERGAVFFLGPSFWRRGRGGKGSERKKRGKGGGIIALPLRSTMILPNVLQNLGGLRHRTEEEKKKKEGELARKGEEEGRSFLTAVYVNTLGFENSMAETDKKGKRGGGEKRRGGSRKGGKEGGKRVIW